MLPIRTILHPTDFSERSQAAFRLACALARDYDACLIALHVMPTEVVYGEGVVLPPSHGYRLEMLEKLEELRAEGPGVRVETRLAEGNPAEQINRLAEEIPCDLIVMGTHGRTGLGRLLMGSVAEQVVRKAPCPVLTVKQPFAQPAEEPVAAASSSRRG
jgi:nucleotide-binding universal stress UspA family protein